MPRPPRQKAAPAGITIGTNDENRALLEALDAVLP